MKMGVACSFHKADDIDVDVIRDVERWTLTVDTLPLGIERIAAQGICGADRVLALSVGATTREDEPCHVLTVTLSTTSARSLAALLINKADVEEGRLDDED